MKNKSFLVILSVVFLAVSCDEKEKKKPVAPVLEGRWEMVPEIEFPGAGERVEPLWCVSGDTLFYGLGHKGLDNLEPVRDIWMLVGREWRKLASFPGRPRENAVGFRIKDKLYVGVGNTWLENYKDMWVYDFRHDTWDSLPFEYPGEARQGAVAFVQGDKGYWGTGGNSNADFGDFYEFDPDNGWNVVHSAFLERQVSSTVFTVDGKVYICFGKQDGGIFKRRVGRFMPVEKRWEYMNYLLPEVYPHIARSGADAFVIRENGEAFAYIVGGERENAEVWEICRYDPRKDEWLQVVSPPFSTGKVRCFVQENTGYAFDGKSVWKFIP